MVTGDQVAIGKEIASSWDSAPTSWTPPFRGTKHHEASQLAEAIETADGFAQVYPEHKYHIVEVLQNRGTWWA